jgi:glycosyltransferase involved in cell wall biosynthesis
VRLTGWGLGLCQHSFFEQRRAVSAKKRGLRIAWGNEMMWFFRQELDHVMAGVIDCLLYTSDVQRKMLEPGYRLAMGGRPQCGKLGPLSGVINPLRLTAGLRWVTVGNYIAPEWFPFKDRFTGRAGRRRSGPLVVGRLSRPDLDKFPDDFPTFYESLGLKNVKFRVMGWDEETAKRWADHVYDDRWEFLPPLTEPQVTFLHSLDLFIYSVSPRFRESWGRAVVEAMLCGAVPLVPAGGGHHLEHLVRHGVSGFVCQDAAEYGAYARLLEEDEDLRKKMSFQAREDAVTRLCNASEHLALWRQVFTP